MSRTICCLETGGILFDGGGATKACVAIVNVAAVPGAGEAFTAASGGVQEPFGMEAVQVNETPPVNPPVPTTLTAKVVVAP